MKTQKFAFDTSFEDSALELNKPLYAQHHMDTQADVHYQKGFDEGVNMALEGIHARNEAQLHIIHENIHALLDLHGNIMERLHKEIGDICHHMATVLFSEISKSVAAQEVEAFLNNIKPEIEKHPTIVIAVHPATRPDLDKKLEDIKNSVADKGHVTVSENDQLHEADCDVSWENGGVDRLFNRSLQAVQEATQRYADRMPTTYKN